MRGCLKSISCLALLSLPALARAYPSDSLLLVRIVTLGSAGDSLKDREFSYGRDNQGFWYETESGRRHDSLLSMERKTYDAAGRDIFDTLYSLLPNGTVYRLSTRAEYDGDGRPVNAILRYNDSLLYTYAYAYGASGKLSKWSITSGPFDSAGLTISSEYDYAYDAQGRLQTETLTSGGALKETISYGYGSGPLPASRLSLKANGDTVYAKTFAYDGEGRLIREISAYGKDTLSLLYMDERTEYDADGMVKTKKQYDKAGYLMFTDAYAYEMVHVPVALSRFRSWRHAVLPFRSADAPACDALGRKLTPRGAGYAGFRLIAAGRGLP